MHSKKAFSFIIATTMLSALLLSTIARAENSAPAIAEFNKVFAATNDYTATIHSHETMGTRSQDRFYNYSFMKPHFAKTLIVSGDGAGSGAVWSGGDTVSGHQGGILSGLHLTVSIHDARATSLRGYTIPDGLLQNIVARYATVPGTLTQSAGGKLGGMMTDRLDLKASDPVSNSGISEQILYLSQETHWPVRQILYAGSQIVLDQSVSDLKTNVGLTQANF